MILGLAGCATQPMMPDPNWLMSQAGVIKEVVQGTPFHHVLYRKSAGGSGSRIHVYISGDGKPWVARFFVAREPTPKNPLIFHLFTQDSVDSIVLGRPCYHGLVKLPECEPKLWTHGRYSAPVLTSMASVITDLLQAGHYDQLVLIGYSGGGTLAQLLAARIPQTQALVTIAGNLDPATWAAHHDYSPLSSSLNPRTDALIPPRVIQVHLAGEHDKNIPPALIHAALAPAQTSDLFVISGFDHGCCWPRIWPSILRWLGRMLDTGVAVKDRTQARQELARLLQEYAD